MLALIAWVQIMPIPADIEDCQSRLLGQVKDREHFRRLYVRDATTFMMAPTTPIIAPTQELLTIGYDFNTGRARNVKEFVCEYPLKDGEPVI